MYRIKGSYSIFIENVGHNLYRFCHLAVQWLDDFHSLKVINILQKFAIFINLCDYII